MRPFSRFEAQFSLILDRLPVISEAEHSTEGVAFENLLWPEVCTVIVGTSIFDGLIS